MTTSPEASPHNKKNVVFVLPALVAGGAERVLISLMNGLNRAYFLPKLISVSGKGPLHSLAAPDIAVHILGNSANVILKLPHLLFALKKAKPDVIVSTMAHMNFAVLLLKPFFPRTRFVVREAITPQFILDRHRGIAPLLRLTYRLLYPRAHVVLSPAQIIADEMTKLFDLPPHNQVVLPNPVDQKIIRSSGPVRTREHPARVHFVAAGRLHFQKGFDRLIAALPQMPHKNWSLVILGEGGEKTALKALIANLGLENHVTLAGHQESPWPFIADADAFVLPSRSEGLPNAVLEALACGTPVIATAESGGIAEIAAQTDKSSLTIVSNMDDFITAMANIRAMPASSFRASLLPPAYEKENINRAFEKIVGAL